MSVLVIDQSVKSNILALIAFAEASPLSMDDLFAMKNGVSALNIKAFSIPVPIHYFVGFTIEYHPPPYGKVRHLSVSLINRPKGAVPHTAVISEIMKEFGFENPLEECHVTIEKDQAMVDIFEIIKQEKL